MLNQLNVFFSHPLTSSYYFQQELMWSQADYILLRENGSKSQLYMWDFANGQNDVKIAAQADGENKNHAGVRLCVPSLLLPQPHCNALPFWHSCLPSPALSCSGKPSKLNCAFGVVQSTSASKYEDRPLHGWGLGGLRRVHERWSKKGLPISEGTAGWLQPGRWQHIETYGPARGISTVTCHCAFHLNGIGMTEPGDTRA